MGFLDNSTNNILIDAVLTEKGREVFASNGANLDEAGLVIVKFALGDDEVDYTNIAKFGLELGRERIEKLTPVFEASTNNSLAIRSKLVSFADSNLEYMPRISISGAGADSVVSLRRQGSAEDTRASLTLRQIIDGDRALSADQRDPLYLVRVPGRFLQIDGQRIVGTDPDKTDLYEIPVDPSGIVPLTISVKPFANDLFDTFAISSGSTDIIRTRVYITGVASGATKELLVNISR